MQEEKVILAFVLPCLRIPRFEKGDLVTPSNPYHVVRSSNHAGFLPAFLAPCVAYEVADIQFSHQGHWTLAFKGIEPGFWFYAIEFEMVCDELGDEYD